MPPSVTIDVDTVGTDWQLPYESHACRARLDEENAYYVVKYMRAAGRSTGFFCKARPVLYSASAKLAYMKTPKAASLAIQDLFQKQFPDYRWAEAREALPNGTFVFTFVRSPLQRVMSAYAEIDVAYALRASQEQRNAMRTTFHHIKRQAGDARRLLAFLDDLLDHRFGGDDREHWMPTHAYPQVNFVCAHRIHFIGHLENQDTDWAEVQARAGIPIASRTGFPHGHTTSNRTAVAANLSSPTCNRACTLKLADQQLPQEPPHALQRECDAFASDFLCLGYPMPKECSWPAEGSGAGSSGASDLVPAVINGTYALPSSRSHFRSAPVYIFDDLNSSSTRMLIESPMYRNTLFLLPSAAENRSDLFRLKRAMNVSFFPPRSENALILRDYDRFGWFWRGALAQGAVDGNSFAGRTRNVQPAAPLAVGIPIPPAVDLIERALKEAQQLLLLHRYDRVVIAGGGGLLTSDDSSPMAHAQRIRDAFAGSLTHPIAAAAAPLRAKASSHLKPGSASAPSPPHKHFLPGRH